MKWLNEDILMPRWAPLFLIFIIVVVAFVLPYLGP